MRTGGYHRLDSKNHPWTERPPLSGFTEIRDMGLLVHRATDTVANELPHHSQAVRLNQRLYSMRDVTDPVTGLTADLDAVFA